MQKTLLTLVSIGLLPNIVVAQTALLESWWINTTGNQIAIYDTTGGVIIDSVLTDVESVCSTATYVYVTSSGIPNYYVPQQTKFEGYDQDYVFRIKISPTAQSGTHTARPASVIGMFIDGSPIYSPGDGQTQPCCPDWDRIAWIFEGLDMDSFNGHGTPTNNYHHHVNNTGVYNTLDSSQHSPIIGWAFDGYPIYGPYSYSNTDGTGAITRMETSYQIRNISSRTTLPDGTASTGPTINAQNPLGGFIQDYEYVAGSGDLDEYNGRFCVTPEYPSGTYAYFVSVAADGEPVYPYFIGDTYYGVVGAGDLGPNATAQTIPGDCTTYTPTSVNSPYKNSFMVSLYPNPAKDFMSVVVAAEAIPATAQLYNSNGVLMETLLLNNTQTQVNTGHLPKGVYFMRVSAINNEAERVQPFVKF